MTEFKNVTVVKEANVYFNGGVTSRTVLFGDGSKKTLGIIQPGEYTFNTDAAELMEILSGELDVQIAGGAWGAVQGGGVVRDPREILFHHEGENGNRLLLLVPRLNLNLISQKQ